MVMKPRHESRELTILKFLNARKNLTINERNYYNLLVKGFKGEQIFDQSLEKLPYDWLVLNDLNFLINNTNIQIDSLIISPVKNYEGNYYIESDRWYSMPKSEIKNPLLQLKRTETQLRRLLEDLRINLSVEAYVVFVNPEFHLYQAPIDEPIIFPTQLNRFFNKLNLNTSKMIVNHSNHAENCFLFT
ncbi:nuclease-related domain-containing protein [Anaerobacillus alkalilacustris]|uniref:nuclease-related domain-containing protein n=1 Tax=Anaerobacillus alkalilacustris TaxID=393763 RepID=UPI0014715D30|nr:nuclease-related domain-containing protein [Anaerobacillus alkalilacustris]